ncbi:cadherin-like beta sandwich domain-containing protein, partial [Bacteroidales bacterium OttesenSCG-928-L14]|nr:cadherin-like beta sandwich domain-containing protein [Bacteroidales bacterium OttesenSCG-928-L14]
MNGELLEGADRYELGAFIDGDCRGTVMSRKAVGYPQSNYLTMIAIWGSSADNGKTVDFKVYDHENEVVYYVDQTLSYVYAESFYILDPLELTIIQDVLYSITINSDGNGNIITDKGEYRESETASLTIIPSLGYELTEINAHKTGDINTPVTINGTTNDRTIVMPAYAVSVNVSFTKTQAAIDAEIIAEAKALIEAETYSLTQEEGNTTEEVKTWLLNKINEIIISTGITVEAADITVLNLIPAIAGNAGNISGTNGSFNFNVTLTKGEQSDIANSTGNSIIATVYIAPTYLLTINCGANGTVTAYKERFKALETVILTISISQGYQLNEIFAYKTGDVNTPVTINGTTNSRTISMPEFDVTVEASFAKTQATIDAEIIAEAKALIEAETYSLTQEEGNTIAEVKTWLLNKINEIILSTGITVEESDITVLNFVPAITGSGSDIDGTNGSFNFTVVLKQGEQSDIATSTGNSIIATIFVPPSFPVTISSSTNGNVTTEKDIYQASETVTLTILPDSKYELDEIKAHKTGDINTTIPINGTTNTRTFVMPAYPITVTASFRLRPLSTDAALFSLEVSEGELDPEFEPTIFEYDVIVDFDIDEIEIIAITNHEEATVSGDTGIQQLSVGNNVLEITVTAEDENYSEIYTVNVYRKSNDTTLSDLTVNAGSLVPSFQSDIFEYAVIVGYNVDEIEITAVANDNNAEVTGDIGNQILNVGDNEFVITITAEDESYTGTYTVNVYRQSNVTTLSSLTVDSWNLLPSFDPNTTTYSISSVPYDTPSITINAATTHSGATISGDGLRAIYTFG